MANALIFPDHYSFERAEGALAGSANYLETLQVPEFSQGLSAPSILTTGNLDSVLVLLDNLSIVVSGAIPFRPFNRVIPPARPPSRKWIEILGDLRINLVRQCISDPIRLRIELEMQKPVGHLIPIMARLIRGGSYRPDVPVLMFEEERKLIAFSSRNIVISRADDLLDYWLMLRCSVDLICTAWENKLSVQPDKEPRQGIGATEIYKRLPNTDCGKCGKMTCMEFALSLLTRKSLIEHCIPLTEVKMASRLQSLLWLMWAIGLIPSNSNVEGSSNMAGSQVSVSDVL